jgi:hypothetical protein
VQDRRAAAGWHADLDGEQGAAGLGAGGEHGDPIESQQQPLGSAVAKSTGSLSMSPNIDRSHV